MLAAVAALALPLAGGGTAPAVAAPLAATAGHARPGHHVKAQAKKHRRRRRDKAHRHHVDHASGGPAAARADRLARRVLHGSLAARYHGLLAIMRSLGVNVVTGQGRPLVIVREPGAAGYFALYDFELRALAQQLRAGTTLTPGVVAAQLTAAAGGTLTVEGKPLDATLLTAALDEGARAALHHPAGSGATTMLLLRALGLAHRGRRYDLARRPQAAAVALDPLQSLLVHLALTMPSLRRLHLHGPGAPPAVHGGGSHGVRHGRRRAHVAVSVAGICQRIVTAQNALQTAIANAVHSVGEKTAIGQMVAFGQGKLQGALEDAMAKFMVSDTEKAAGKKAAQTFEKGLTDASDSVGEFLSVVDAIHDVFLASMVQVQVSGGAQQTHWSHGDGVTGKPMQFSVEVWMPFDLGKAAVNCGPLAHLQFPAKGPIKGVPVMWGQTPVHDGLLGVLLHPIDAVTDDVLSPAMATTSCGTLPCSTATGADGIARLTVTPNSEPIPGIGPVHQSKGHIYPTVLYQTASGGGLFVGQIAQFLFPKGTTAFGWKPPAWEVDYHKIPNFQLRLSTTVTPHDTAPVTTTLGCQTFTAQDGGALSVDATFDDLDLTSAPDASPLTFARSQSVFGNSSVPLTHTDTSLQEHHVDDYACPTVDAHYDFTDTITDVHDGAMSAKVAVDPARARSGGPDPGVTVSLTLTDWPLEHFTYPDPTDPSDNWTQAWGGAVDQVLAGGDRGVVDLPTTYTIGGWTRGTGDVYATKTIDASDVLDNYDEGVAVDVHIEMQLVAVPPA